MVTKLEWEAILRKHNYCCPICGRSEEEVGGLIKSHLKAGSKGGTQYIPLCSNDHKRFDNGKLKDSELLSIGIDPEKYHKYRSKKGVKKEKSAYEEVMKAEKEVAKKIKKMS